MAEKPIDVTGWKGVDTTTDEFLLGQKAPDVSPLAYNYRVKNGIHVGRPGFTPVIDFASGVYPTKSGVYFPPGSKAILPHTSVDYTNSFYLAGTQAVPQTEFTVEFWYRGAQVTEYRTVLDIPVDFGTDINTVEVTSLLKIRMGPSTVVQGGARLIVNVALSDGATAEAIGLQEYYKSTEYLELDDEWHHVAIYMKPADVTNMYYSLDGGSEVTMDKVKVLSGYTMLPTNDAHKDDHETPKYYNHMELGGDDMSYAEFRIWDHQRTAEELSDYKDVELDGDETGLVCYVPFNEGAGKHFTETANSTRGYFTPQSPYVNDDDELVFTGYNCMAYPSLRASWAPYVYDKEPTHDLDNQDAAYDGGIIWDTVLGLNSELDWDDEGVDQGVVQMRIRLRQLKEGVLCGRLGMLYDNSDEAYRLFFIDPTNNQTYISTAEIDDTWIGVEKTITIYYRGLSIYDPEDRCNIYIDTVDYADPSPGVSDVWGDASNTEILDSTYRPYEDTEDSDDTSGAIGGSTEHTEMCIAFDLIFFRQWIGYPPGKDTDTFIENTYNTHELNDSYKYVSRDLTGYIKADDNVAVFTGIEDTGFAIWTPMFLRLPVHYNVFDEDMDGNGETYVILDNDADSIPKQDVFIRRLCEIAASPLNELQILPDAEVYAFKATTPMRGSKLHFNGALMSKCVNYYDRNTFKKNKLRRYVYYDTTEAAVVRAKDLELYDTITDDSPLQSIERAGSALYDSRYLILGNEARHTIKTGMRSLMPRWCDGPIEPDVLPPIRGIYRYTSEDKEIDRLVVAAWSAIWELDEDTGTLTKQKWAWLERNDDEPLSFLAANNMLLAMDSTGLLKLNWRGNWSRCGLERPVEVLHDTHDVVASGVHAQDQHIAYVAQFHDSENNSYSGTLPIYSDEDQGFIVLDSDGLRFFDIKVRGSKEPNIDKCLIWRTADMENTGTATDLYLAQKTDNPFMPEDWVTHRDIWASDQITDQEYLSSIYWGNDLIPKPAKAMAIGYNRIFLFNNADEKSSMFWSDVDTLGFPKPDHFPENYKMIVEEGDTTEGTALIEFSNQLFAFKENAIFLIEQTSQIGFTNRLLYKGVGAVNQRSVVVAGNSLIFIDRSGIYRYAGGEPVMLSPTLSDFFRDSVNQTNVTEKAFILYDKTDDMVYGFVPSTGSSYCDRVVVFDLRNNTFTIDLIPYTTCGYVDDMDMYIGTPYGQVLKVSKTVYLDGVTTGYTGTGTVL